MVACKLFILNYTFRIYLNPQHPNQAIDHQKNFEQVAEFEYKFGPIAEINLFVGLCPRLASRLMMEYDSTHPLRASGHNRWRSSRFRLKNRGGGRSPCGLLGSRRCAHPELSGIHRPDFQTWRCRRFFR